MFSFRKHKSKHSVEKATIPEREKPFAISNRVRISDEAEPLYPGLLETRCLDQYSPREQLLVEQAVSEMLRHSSIASSNVSRPREAPQSRYSRNQRGPSVDTHSKTLPDSSSDRLRREIEAFLEQPAVDPVTPAKSHIACQERRKQHRPSMPRNKSSQGRVAQVTRVQTFLEQPTSDAVAAAKSHITYQKRRRQQRPVMPRKKSSQGRVAQLGRVQPLLPTTYRPLKGTGKPVGATAGDVALPDIVREIRRESTMSRRSTWLTAANMNPAASGYCETEGNAEQWSDVDDLGSLEWGEVPIVLDPRIRPC